MGGPASSRPACGLWCGGQGLVVLLVVVLEEEEGAQACRMSSVVLGVSSYRARACTTITPAAAAPRVQPASVRASQPASISFTGPVVSECVSPPHDDLGGLLDGRRLPEGRTVVPAAAPLLLPAAQPELVVACLCLVAGSHWLSDAGPVPAQTLPLPPAHAPQHLATCTTTPHPHQPPWSLLCLPACLLPACLSVSPRLSSPRGFSMAPPLLLLDDDDEGGGPNPPPLCCCCRRCCCCCCLSLRCSSARLLGRSSCPYS